MAQSDSTISSGEIQNTEEKIEIVRLYFDNNHFDKPVPLHTYLRAIASQENHDGEEYDAMMIAGQYIDGLEKEIARMKHDHRVLGEKIKKALEEEL